MSHRAAVIGAGPSGFYATEQLLKAGFAVDLYESLPTPLALVPSTFSQTDGQSQTYTGLTPDVDHLFQADVPAGWPD